MAAVTSIPRTTLRRIPLGSAKDVFVPDVCLGTMTWGVQNTEAEAHEQLDYAIKQRGVNFIDTAEMYPVPMSDPSWMPGTTEKFIGSWLAKELHSVMPNSGQRGTVLHAGNNEAHHWLVHSMLSF